ncbi:MAG: DUF4065 domain-containing protein [Salinarimonadaceae bacterium]|nr:MAG: DUF4065 domain-containing protein [Salinarimonadaceae bacterium]
MLITHEREKLIHSIIYFVRNTKYCGKVKLFKLLYFFDFEHFKQTGRSVTGMNYSAWKMGPVPVDLFEEIDRPEPDMAESIRFEEKAYKNGERMMLVMTPQIEFSDRHFTKREIRLLNSLSSEFRETLADEMIEATHLENMPWDKVYNKEGRKRAHIPYELALRPDDADAVNAVARERKELLEKLA